MGTKKSPSQSLRLIEIAHRTAILMTLLAAEAVTSHILRPITDLHNYYLVALGFTCLTGLATILFGVNRLVRDFQEICLYDVFVQFVGIVLLTFGKSDAIYLILANTILYIKFMRACWPMASTQKGEVQGWPIFGLIGLWVPRHESARELASLSQRPSFIYLCMAATMLLSILRQSLPPKFQLPYVWVLVAIIGFLTTARFVRTLKQNAATQEQAEEAAKLAIAQRAEAQAIARIATIEKEQLAAMVVERDAMLADLTYRNESVRNAAHDLALPSRFLDSLLREAHEQANTPAQKVYMEQAVVAAVELFEMVNDVLYQAQVNTRLIAPKTEALRVSQIRQYFADRMLKEGNDMGIEYFSNEQDFAIVANEPLLRRVIANLLGNAIYHGRPGDEVSLKFSRNATHAFIWVRDTGLGFDDANTPERAANFTRMVQKVRQRVHGAQSAHTGLLGQRLHGLGLASIERICTELNGTMTLRSRPKHGSVFCLRLPLDNPQPKVRGQALKK